MDAQVQDSGVKIETNAVLPVFLFSNRMLLFTHFVFGLFDLGVDSLPEYRYPEWAEQVVGIERLPGDRGLPAHRPDRSAGPYGWRIQQLHLPGLA